MLSATKRAEVAAQYAQSGEAALAQRDYRQAAIQLARAWRLNPQRPDVALQLGRAYEHLQESDKAANAYRAGLPVASLNQELKQELAYRLALLAAFKLKRVEEIPLLLEMLPSQSFRAADVRAVLALLAGDGRQALLELNAARSVSLNEEQAALILFHAAQAYVLVGEKERAFAVLYDAINNAGYAPFTVDIERFRNRLKGYSDQ